MTETDSSCEYCEYKICHENAVQEIQRLRKVLEYNQEYISYLLGVYTKEEFLKIAERYAEPLNLPFSPDAQKQDTQQNRGITRHGKGILEEAKLNRKE